MLMFDPHSNVSLPAVVGFSLVLIALLLALLSPILPQYGDIWTRLMYAGLAAIGAGTAEVGVAKWQTLSSKS